MRRLKEGTIHNRNNAPPTIYSLFKGVVEQTLVLYYTLTITVLKFE